MLSNHFKNAEKAQTTPTIMDAYDHITGPISYGINPVFIRKKSDWSPEYNLLWVRQKSVVYPYNPTPDSENGCISSCNIAMTIEGIVKFISETIKRSANHEFTLVAVTKNSNGGMFPEAVCLELKDGKAKVETSSFCKKEDVDYYTEELIQKVLDSQGIGINFRQAVGKWTGQKLLIQT